MVTPVTLLFENRYVVSYPKNTVDASSASDQLLNLNRQVLSCIFIKFCCQLIQQAVYFRIRYRSDWMPMCCASFHADIFQDHRYLPPAHSRSAYQNPGISHVQQRLVTHSIQSDLNTYIFQTRLCCLCIYIQFFTACIDDKIQIQYFAFRLSPQKPSPSRSSQPASAKRLRPSDHMHSHPAVRQIQSPVSVDRSFSWSCTAY